jgi:sulfate transport system ATP-binding protein
VAGVFVTHDQEEALEVADRVAIMNRGLIEQVGTPIEVYDNPASAFVYQFLGDVNLFHGRSEAADAPALGYVRPYEMDVTRHLETTEGVVATVRHIASAGPVVRLELKREDNGNSMDAEISRECYRELGLAVGDKVDVTPRNLRTFSS